MTDANLYERFRARFPADRSLPFIESGEIGGGNYSYCDLEETSGRYAGALANLGVGKGDRVAALVEKSAEAIFLYLACWRVGAIYLPLNPAYREAEVEYFLGDAEPTVTVCQTGRASEIQEIAKRRGGGSVLTLDHTGSGTLVEASAGCDSKPPSATVASDDIAAILYTSGTTGRSKGAMLSHRNLGSNAETLHRIWGFQPDDVLLHALPIFHTHGLFVATNCVLMNGSRMLFLPKFNADAIIRLLPQATVLMGVPTFYTRLLAHTGLRAEVCANMRLFISGSAPLREETFDAFRDRTGHTILERYGMTETGIDTSNPLDGERIAGTVGPPLPDVEARVVGGDGEPLPVGETGVLEVRGPNVFKGYWRMPEKTREEFRPDGFFVTGDIARIDANGYVSIVGRAKDLIISGGFNVYPKEIETRIDEFPAVAESAVIGLPHPDFGEAVVAVIKAQGDAKNADGEAIIAALKQDMATYKVPKRVFFVDDLPRNAMGKVQKNLLRERFAETFAKPE